MRLSRRFVMGALVAVGCTRSVPDTYPANAPVSSQAPEATPAHVTLALHREPPLPGESTAGWAGLEAAAGGEAAHQHHHHHHPMQHDAGMSMQLPADGGMHHAH